MPRGVYTGFKANSEVCPEDGIIALMGYPAKPDKSKDHDYKVFELIYIDNNGVQVFLNQKDVLDAITHHKDLERFVPDAIDKGDEAAIQKLVTALKKYLDSQKADVEKQADGSEKKVMGKESKDLLVKLRKGDKKAVERVKQNVTVDEKYQLTNFDLITWFIVTN